MKLIAALTNSTAVYGYSVELYDEETNNYELKERQHLGYELVSHFTYLLILLALIGMGVELTRCLDRYTEELDAAQIPRQVERRSEK